MNTTLLVAWREILHNLRDVRSVTTMLLLAFITTPITVYLLPLLMMNAGSSAKKEVVVLAVHKVDAQLQKVLAKSYTLKIHANPKAAVLEGVAPLGLSCDKNCVLVSKAGSSQKIAVQTDQLQQLLLDYRSQLVERELLKLGVSKNQLHPFDIKLQDVSKPEAKTNLLSAMLPYMLCMFLLTGGMATACEITAGEKEKGTLEPMLVTPIKPTELLLGKVLAVMTFCLLSAGSALLGLQLGGKLYAMLDHSGSNLVQTSTAQNMGGMGIVASMLVFGLFISAIMVALGIYAKTIKEAQNLITPLVLVMMVPLIFVMMKDFFTISDMVYLLPFMNVFMLIDAFTRNAQTDAQVLMCWLSTLVYAALALFAAYKNFSKEDVLFRN